MLMLPDTGLESIHWKPWGRQFLDVLRIEGICNTLLILEISEIMVYCSVDRLRLGVLVGRLHESSKGLLAFPGHTNIHALSHLLRFLRTGPISVHDRFTQVD